jgi:hypothetical protein
MSDLTLETLKALRADMARFDLRLTDVLNEMRRVSIVHGKTDAVRHDADIALERVRDLHVRVQALEDKP